MRGRWRKQGSPSRQEGGQGAQSFPTRGARATGRRQGRLCNVVPEGGDRAGVSSSLPHGQTFLDREPEELQATRLLEARPGCATLGKHPDLSGPQFPCG